MKSVKKTKQVGQVSVSALLGVKPIQPVVREPTCCVICGKLLNTPRIAALKELATPLTNWTCVKDSQTKKVLGQYMGEMGTSEMKIVDRIEEVSVRTMFRTSVNEESNGQETPE